jgi:hypothetical protein
MPCAEVQVHLYPAAHTVNEFGVVAVYAEPATKLITHQETPFSVAILQSFTLGYFTLLYLLEFRIVAIAFKYLFSASVLVFILYCLSL